VLPAYTTPVPERRPARPRWRVVGVVVAVFAVLCGSAFAYLAVTAPDGAATPEEAVRHLFEAIDQEDAIGVLESLPPSERDVLKEPIVDIVTELQRLGILKPFELDKVPGEDLTVDGLTLAVEPVGSNDDLKAVRVTGGTIRGSTVPAEVPIGDTLRHIVDDDFGEKVEVPASSFSQDLAKGNLRMVTVKEGGGWHVSLFYSIAEAIRGDRTAAPVLGNGPKPVGATTPDGALNELVTAAMNLDLDKVIGMLPPDEMRAVYDYAPLFLPDAKKSIDKNSSGFSGKVNRLDTHVEGEGSVRQVFVTGFDVEVGDTYEKIHATWDGSCVVYDETSTSRYSSETSSGSSGSSSGTTNVTHGEICTDKPSSVTRQGTSTTNDLDLGAFNGLAKDYAVVVVERDGRWFVSPTRTVFDSLLTRLRKTSREDIERWSKELADWTGSSPAYRECQKANPYVSGSLGSSYNRSDYLRRKALDECLKKAGVKPMSSYVDPCYSTYADLGDDPSEDEWDEADDKVRECQDRRYGTSSGTTPGTARSGTIPRYPGSSGTGSVGSGSSGTSIPRSQTSTRGSTIPRSTTTSTDPDSVG
jgi:hypothetical protein